MSEILYNLLTEPIITVRSRDGTRRGVSLPELLEQLGSDGVSDFPALRPHQQHAWHAFLVQLAAIALHRANKTEPQQDAATWTSMLHALTDGADEPWCLVVEDLKRPAFLQPPVPEGKLASGKGKEWAAIICADALDLLQTSKNHDLKGERAARSTPEQWLLALLSLQTMQGYSGRDNHGIARMNSGYGNRPGVSLAPSLSPGSRFAREVKLLLRHREDVTSANGYSADNGVALLWLEPWDGLSMLSPQRLDPWFIEICRRVRLVVENGGMVARTTSTKVPRLSDESAAHGVTGDPWTPVEKTGKDAPKALTVPAGGFDYDRVQKLLLSGDVEHALTQVPQSDDPQGMLLLAQAMTRGQGKTEGLHQRIVPVPGKVRAMLGKVDERARLAAWASTRVEIVVKVRRKVLHMSLCALLQGGADKLNPKDRSDQRWQDNLDSAVDDIFFERLWRDVDLDPTEAQAHWAAEVLDLARAQLEDAIESAPLPSARRYRAIAAAQGLFEGSARKHFPDCVTKGEPTHGADHDDECRAAAE